MGLIANIVVGIVGGSLGGWILSRLGIGFGSGWMGFLITALIGAAVLLLAINLLTLGRAR